MSECQISGDFKSKEITTSRCKSRLLDLQEQFVRDCWCERSRQWIRLLDGYSRCSPRADEDIQPALSHDPCIGPCRARWDQYQLRALYAARNPNTCNTTEPECRLRYHDNSVT